MFRLSMSALLGFLIVITAGGLTGQEAKKADPAKKDDSKTTAKEDVKTGRLPPNYTKLGLSDLQKKEIYRIEGKYKAEIDNHQKKMTELKTTMDKEIKDVLTPEQKKRLEDIQTGKDK